MNSVVCFLWNNGYRHYEPSQVNMLYRSVKHFYKGNFRFVCVTDFPKRRFSRGIEVVRLPKSLEWVCDIPAPQGKDFPSSYRRLWCFSEEAKVLGDRILLIDVDAMVLGDLSVLFDEYDSDFVGWRPRSIWGREDRIGGGTWCLKTGTLTHIWEEFSSNPRAMIDSAKAAGWAGSDQAILSQQLAHKYPVWPHDCGIYGSQDGVFFWSLPPKDARIVHFNGSEKLWNVNSLWVKAYCNHFACNS